MHVTEFFTRVIGTIQGLNGVQLLILAEIVALFAVLYLIWIKHRAQSQFDQNVRLMHVAHQKCMVELHEGHQKRKVELTKIHNDFVLAVQEQTAELHRLRLEREKLGLPRVW